MVLGFFGEISFPKGMADTPSCAEKAGWGLREGRILFLRVDSLLFQCLDCGRQTLATADAEGRERAA
jgi:hypothetical protein